ncbi:DUF1684 domain-containing protein [Williamsia phyllosphaerae]|uniref:DUF1684 domain-containing protein n=1 Tax=Williamsia phyllosphaerae TaxID=885042 RepID=A0ABQ1V375_9NOCA|nr:DUF1684 domain-containing protein [Williamsia phyllosphaerae]GGF36868.1 hypothetical protein GCM10007298_35760 [Williamsia phyllosphaerae]
MTITRDTDTFTTDWQRWHAQRVGAAKAAYGLAAVTGTHWIGAEPSDYPGVPGRWSVRDGRVVGTDVVGAPLDLEVGTAWRLGDTDLEVRVLSRGDDVAIRVVDPAAETRSELLDIDAFEPDPAWVVQGRFTAAESDATITVDHADGAVLDDPLAGHIAVVLDGETHSLAAFPVAGGGLQVSFSDATSGSETARFRFVTTAAPDDEGGVSIDFNRSYLPPSTFTAYYLCPMPPEQNRLSVDIRAGEKLPRTTADHA